MPNMLTDKQTVNLAKMLIVMNIPREMRLEILTAIETNTELLLFLDKLSARNYEMKPEEVYQAMLDTIEETTLKDFSTGNGSVC